MTGERHRGWGVDWGAVGEMPRSAYCAHSDAAAAELVASAHSGGRPVPPIVLAGGDMARTLGVSGACPEEGSPDPHPWSPNSCTVGESGGGEDDVGPARRATRLEVDLGAVRIDGRQCWFLAHLTARRSWWRGRLLVVANASFMGEWNITPRAHPGDGRLHVLDTRAPISVRWSALRRLPSGAHLPHPGIAQRRITRARFSLDPPLDVYLDRRRQARASRLEIEVAPAALRVWVPVPATPGAPVASAPTAHRADAG